MLKRGLFLFQILLLGVITSCRTSKPVISSYNSSNSGNPAVDYINRYKDLAVSEMKRTGVPASITLSQGMIESDYGRSTLARDANNHFGIKCHSDWTGPTIRHHDDKRNECFRKYKKPEESYYDHSDFLKSGSRYKSLFYLNSTDYKGWARGLKKAGYATNPDYANMLIRKIEEYNLTYFDRNNKSSSLLPPYSIEDKKPVIDSNTSKNNEPMPVFDSNSGVYAKAQRVLEINRIKYIIVKEGDTRQKLENEFKLLNWELPRYNELESDFSLFPGQILYLQPKRNKAEPGKEYHTFSDGDSMYLISQRYGVKLKSLYEMNRLNEGDKPETGTKIWLRSMKPVR